MVSTFFRVLFLACDGRRRDEASGIYNRCLKNQQGKKVIVCKPDNRTRIKTSLACLWGRFFDIYLSRKSMNIPIIFNSFLKNIACKKSNIQSTYYNNNIHLAICISTILSTTSNKTATLYGLSAN